MTSTAHLPKPADPAQMSDWRRDPCGVSAVVYYPERTTVVIRPYDNTGINAQAVLESNGRRFWISAIWVASTMDDAERTAATVALEFIGVEVAT